MQKTLKEKKLIKWMSIVSILFIIISAYLLYLHYADVTSFCDISEGLSCDIVNKSRYSEFPPGSGIPVSLMGIITFIIVLITLKYIKKNKTFNVGNKKIDKKNLSRFLFYLMIISLLFSIYLVYAELFLILSLCILCVALDILIIIMLILSYKLKEAFL
mgnify:CR=1 FL=1